MRVYGSLVNRIIEHTTGDPVVGMGCTICGYSDRHAATVIEVKTPRKIVVQEDSAVRIDKNGMSECQEYEYSRNPNGSKIVFTKRKNGAWKESKGSYGLQLGSRNKYYDFSF